MRTRTWAGEYKWADIRSWPQHHLMAVDAELFDDGYELNREARSDPSLVLRVQRMWRMSIATQREILRRRSEREVERVLNAVLPPR